MLNADEEGQTHQELRGELNCGMTESRHQIDGQVLVNTYAGSGSLRSMPQPGFG